MTKDFKKWCPKKEKINLQSSKIFFKEREVWWCATGANVGYEQDGHGVDFARPVLIVKKFNLDACLIVPLTKSGKEGKYYFSIGEVRAINTYEAVAVLSQVRFIDRKRLLFKIQTIDKERFSKLIEKIINSNFKDVG